ncbi:MAG: UvrD-helicase domain-containing protein, partial [Bdellovibrionales bacterium]|nr:UvrD-helicase domain-containing protein [Bdellovibrionales bacterium]
MSRTTLELKNEIVRAGAGAGKTTKLTAKVLEVASLFFEQHKRAPKVVVTTFTRKATEELRERLVREACKLGKTELVDFVTSHGNLHISTIHGVLSLFLRRYGHIINFDTGFTILEPQAASRLSRKILRDLLIKNLEFEELLEHYTFDQLTQVIRMFSDALHERGELTPYSESDLLDLLELEKERIAQNLTHI